MVSARDLSVRSADGETGYGRIRSRRGTEPETRMLRIFCFLYHRHVFLQFIFINEVNFVFFYIPPHFHFFYNEISVRMGVKTYRHMDMYIQTTLRQTSTYLYTKK